jgi:hypothetical protein
MVAYYRQAIIWIVNQFEPLLLLSPHSLIQRSLTILSFDTTIYNLSYWQCDVWNKLDLPKTALLHFVLCKWEKYPFSARKIQTVFEKKLLKMCGHTKQEDEGNE